VGFDADDPPLVGANNMELYDIYFNNGLNVAVMTRIGVLEAYSNDHKHLGKIDF